MIPRRSAAIIIGIALVTSCAGPVALGPVKPNPFVHPVEGMKDTILQVYFAPAVQDAFRVEPTNMRPIDVSQFRSSLREGLTRAFCGSFQRVVFVDSVPALCLVLSLERCEPRGIKAGNVPVADGIVAYDLRFDVRYLASLVEEGQKVASAQNEVTGKDVSWKAADQPRLMENSLELMVVDLRDKLFARH